MCGIGGITNCDDVSYYLLDLAEQIQHRGQDSAGMLTWHDNDRFDRKRGKGLAREVFGIYPNLSKRLSGRSGIVHVRYTTAGKGKGDPEYVEHNAQPLYTESPISLGVQHNGNVTNPRELREMLEEHGLPIRTDCDAELIMRDFQRLLKEKKYYKYLSDDGLDNEFIFDIAAEVMDDVDGAYAVCMLLNDGKMSGPKMIAMADRHRIRPAVYGKLGEGFVLASETVALDVLDAEYISDIGAGEVIIFDGNEFIPRQVARGDPRYCFFEWIYFQNPSSKILGIPVYGARKKLGGIIARRFSGNIDLVAKSPDSGAGYNFGFGNAIGADVVDAFSKNRYIGRTFIAPDNKGRKRMNRKKMNPINCETEGKKILITDDSIIRGNASSNLVELGRRYGKAEEMHFMFGCVPRYRCIYGIAMTDKKEFIGSGKNDEEIAREIGADSAISGEPHEIAEAIGLAEENLCMACLNKKYPTDIDKCSYDYDSGFC